MQIVWNSNTNQSPYLFYQVGVWSGIKIRRAKVLPGRMLEHKADFHEINITLNGKLSVEKNSATGKKIVTKSGAGNVCITPCGQPVGAYWNNTLDNMGIFLTPEFVAQTAIENRFSPDFELFEIYKNEDALVQQIALNLLTESNSDTPTGKLYTDSLIQTLTLHLLKNYTNANSVKENLNGGLSGYKLRRVQEFIDANLEEDLSLAELAEVADLSQFHFARAFRKSTGKTPQNYLMEQRIERAKQLLAKEDLPIVEVSLQTGFKNQSHFTTLFRKFTKLTPKMWREMKLA
jgi:AraC family transcriptional regulator